LTLSSRNNKIKKIFQKTPSFVSLIPVLFQEFVSSYLEAQLINIFTPIQTVTSYSYPHPTILNRDETLWCGLTLWWRSATTF